MLFHHLGKAPRGHIAQVQLFGHGLGGLDGVFVSTGFFQPEPRQDRRKSLAIHLAQGPVGPDPLASAQLVVVQPVARDVVLAPGELGFAN